MSVLPDAVKIQRLRTEKGLTVEVLSQRSRVSRRTIQKIEKGTPCSIETLQILADFFKVEFAELLRTEKKKGIVISIKMDPAPLEFKTQEDADKFLKTLKMLIGSGGSMKIEGIDDGSVIVKVEMSEEDIKKLLLAFINGGLSSLNVTGIGLPKPAQSLVPEDPLWAGKYKGYHRPTMWIDERRIEELKEYFGQSDVG